MLVVGLEPWDLGNAIVIVLRPWVSIKPPDNAYGERYRREPRGDTP